MMIRDLTFLWLIALVLFSCNSPGNKTPGNRIELIQLGPPQYLDQNNWRKVGGIIYTAYEEGSDSILFKSCMMEELFETGAYTSDSLTAVYFYGDAKDSLGKQLDYLINYLKPLKDGRLPGNYRNEDAIGCNLLGTWLAILTDSLNKRHYYNFSVHNLPEPIKSACESVYRLSTPDAYQQQIVYRHINTDSIVAAVLQLPSMDSIELVPKRRPSIRFTPPDIVPN